MIDPRGLARSVRKIKAGLIRQFELSDFKPCGENYAAGYCAILSYEVAKRLIKRGYWVTMHVSPHHAYLVVNGFLVDPTYDQIAGAHGEDIYIGKLTDPKTSELLKSKMYSYPARIAFSNDFDLVGSIFKLWPEHQLPLPLQTEAPDLSKIAAMQGNG